MRLNITVRFRRIPAFAECAAATPRCWKVMIRMPGDIGKGIAIKPVEAAVDLTDGAYLAPASVSKLSIITTKNDGIGTGGIQQESASTTQVTAIHGLPLTVWERPLLAAGRVRSSPPYR